MNLFSAPVLPSVMSHVEWSLPVPSLSRRSKGSRCLKREKRVGGEFLLSPAYCFLFYQKYSPNPDYS